MNELITDRIRRDFPDVAWESSAAAWGIECGTGWGLLIYSFFSDAKGLCDKSGGKMVVSQIKNKFGTLRLYCHVSGGDSDEANGRSDFVPEQYGRVFSFRPYPKDPTFRALVTYYEQASAHICELCGKAGHIDRDLSSWLIPLCHPHAEVVRKSRPDDANEGFDEIDRKAAESILTRIDQLTKSKTEK